MKRKQSGIASSLAIGAMIVVTTMVVVLMLYVMTPTPARGGAGGVPISLYKDKASPLSVDMGAANLSWDDYGNKYANKTKVGDASIVMTDTRLNRFGSDMDKVREFNEKMKSEGRIPLQRTN